jgi:hypothetical protein
MNIPAAHAHALLETDFKNICAKLEAGGTLTTSERAMMERFATAAPPAPAEPPPPEDPPEPATPHALTAVLAAEWQVKARTARRWVRRFGPAVCAAPAALAERLLQAGRGLDHVRRRATDLLARPRADAPGAAPAEDLGEAGTLRGYLAQQERILALTIRRIETASAARDARGNLVPDVLTITRESGLARRASDNVLAVRRQMAKQGLDSGDLIGRATFEVIIYSIANRMILGVSRLRDQRAPEFVGLETEAAAAEALEPALLIAGFLAPLARAANQAAGIGLPGWVVDAFTKAAGDHLAQGEAQLRQARQTDLTEHN